ncbi:MAG: tetratricopeptide repeat protein [Deltaproteobacteria bacterium]|nr:tetratricopeptide repeat protein [Deltaproteobacteria bacterium]
MSPLSDDPHFGQIRNLLSHYCGLQFCDSSSDFLARGVLQRMQHYRYLHYAEYLNHLMFHARREDELAALLDLVTIGETYFFRYAPQLEIFAKRILPKLGIDKTLAAGRPSLRIWCAACSSGEEPYTLAILIRENLPSLHEWDLSILATDVNRISLDAARKAVYGQRAVTTACPPAYIHRYFTQHDNLYEVNDNIKKMVTFRRHNLVNDPYTDAEMTNLDLIFCRNTFIYFSPELIKTILEKFHDCLTEDGFFCPGASDSFPIISDRFSALEFDEGFLYKKQSATTAPLRIETPPLPKPPVVAKPAFNGDQILLQAIQTANSGDYEKAREQLTSLVAADNLCLMAYYWLGLIAEKQGFYEEAIRHYQRGLYIDSNVIVLHFRLSQVFASTGRKQEAQRAGTTCLDLLKPLKPQDEAPSADGMNVETLRQAIHRHLKSIL